MNVLDLFCGCGGLSYYFEKPQFNISLSIDIWQPALDTILANKDHKVLCADISNLNPEELGLENIDIVIGGFPCQGFSSAGRRDKDDPRNTLFMDYIRYVKHFSPKLCLIENVVGLLTMKTEDGIYIKDIIIKNLSDIGYTVTYKVLNSADYKVAQKRRRVIFIAVRNDIQKEWVFPEPNSEFTPVRDLIDTKDLDPKLFLSEKAILGINRKKQQSKERGAGWGAQFLDLDKPCFTIPARYYKDGYDALVKYDEERIRRLSVKELARIQSFPENYKFSGSKREIIMQIGNAVPCLLGKVLGETIHTFLTT